MQSNLNNSLKESYANEANIGSESWMSGSFLDDNDKFWTLENKQDIPGFKMLL